MRVEVGVAVGAGLGVGEGSGGRVVGLGTNDGMGDGIVVGDSSRVSALVQALNREGATRAIVAITIVALILIAQGMFCSTKRA